jgi:hypothetical protein
MKKQDGVKSQTGMHKTRAIKFGSVANDIFLHFSAVFPLNIKMSTSS